MANRLRNLEIFEVSSVDKGAAHGARVVLTKRHDERENQMSALDQDRRVASDVSKNIKYLMDRGLSRDEAATQVFRFEKAGGYSGAEDGEDISNSPKRRTSPSHGAAEEQAADMPNTLSRAFRCRYRRAGRGQRGMGRRDQTFDACARRISRQCRVNVARAEFQRGPSHRRAPADGQGDLGLYESDRHEKLGRSRDRRFPQDALTAQSRWRMGWDNQFSEFETRHLRWLVAEQHTPISASYVVFRAPGSLIKKAQKLGCPSANCTRRNAARSA